MNHVKKHEITRPVKVTTHMKLEPSKKVSTPMKLEPSKKVTTHMQTC